MFSSSCKRDQTRSKYLRKLAEERKGITKRPKLDKAEPQEQNDDSDEEERMQLNQKRMLPKSSCSLVAILPKPKRASLFGPTVKLDKLLRVPDRAEAGSCILRQQDEDRPDRINEDGMLEVDVGKMITDVSDTALRDLTVEKSRHTVIVPKGKERQKNQITYIAQLGKATELERKDQAAQSRVNKAAARSKYGW